MITSQSTTSTPQRRRPKRPMAVEHRSFSKTRQSDSRPSAKAKYERYLALAREQSLAGDAISAENYYQHAEHYFRTMSDSPQ